MSEIPTSQDVVDSAAMVVARDALTIVERDLAAVEDACARLAETHRETIMVGWPLHFPARVPRPSGRKDSAMPASVATIVWRRLMPSEKSTAPTARLSTDEVVANQSQNRL